jgi:two-component system response regulator AtoC
VPVLLQGETGVGKEVLARHIHDQSQRSGKIFLKLNCAALPPELVESELFGYEKGAFTGAFKSTSGKFELANGGTILLDEIGDMDLRLQAKLLQVLQDHEFHRIGAKEPTQVDVRVIAATHRDLADRISQGEFREDLYYRLNVLNIVIPPLRERPDEIIPLALSFLKKHGNVDCPMPEIGPSLRNALLGHHWPGNIRELENVMRRYLVVRSPDLIVDELKGLNRKFGDRRMPTASVSDVQSRWSGNSMLGGSDLFSKPMLSGSSQQVSRDLPSDGHHPARPVERENSELVKLDQVRQAAETEVIMKALYSTQWNRKRAASLLGVDYKALLYKMKKLGID